ncbi:MAG: J domain-containing protein [Oscillospiraceae bacterium]|nr:J domain-containing protein [Oscillospiraceae bacterium]
MKTPYRILGVAQNADAQQLREAYQALAQRHEGNARRMREINDAYDAILLSRGGEGSEALALLERVPEEQRGSEWHYRMGCVQRERGWLEEAEARFAHAALFDPKNRKYRAALKQARRGRSGKSVKGSFSEGAVDACVECCGECVCDVIC